MVVRRLLFALIVLMLRRFRIFDRTASTVVCRVKVRLWRCLMPSRRDKLRTFDNMAALVLSRMRCARPETIISAGVNLCRIAHRRLLLILLRHLLQKLLLLNLFAMRTSLLPLFSLNLGVQTISVIFYRELLVVIDWDSDSTTTLKLVRISRELADVRVA